MPHIEGVQDGFSRFWVKTVKNLLNSPKYKKLSFVSIDINLINLLKDQADLVYDGKRVIWSRDFRSLQNFVENVIGLSGTWRSSGGKSKQFPTQIQILL
jgi:hypothetical protein